MDERTENARIFMQSKEGGVSANNSSFFEEKHQGNPSFNDPEFMKRNALMAKYSRARSALGISTNNFAH